MRRLASLPVDDWQFWVVSALACVAVLMVVRMVLPPGMMPKPLRRKTGQRRATLTVGGKAVDQKSSPHGPAGGAEQGAKD